MKTRNTAAVILSLMMCICLIAGCGGNANEPTVDQGSGQQAAGGQGSSGTGATAAPEQPQIALEDDEEVWYAEAIVLLCDAPIPALDPMDPAASTVPTLWTFTMIHDRLLSRDAATGEIGPSIATEWSSTDNRTFNFRLRDDAVFHDGEKLTASDVVFTVNRGKESPGSEAHALWSNVETAREINEFEVELVLASANANFLSDLTMPFAGILSEISISFDPDFGPAIGTGAYAVIDFRQGSHVQLVRNETYWGASRDIITDWVRLQHVTDADTIIDMMQYDEAQVYIGINGADVSILENDHDNFGVTRLENVIVSANGIGGANWASGAGDIDLREIHRVVDEWY